MHCIHLTWLKILLGWTNFFGIYLSDELWLANIFLCYILSMLTSWFSWPLSVPHKNDKNIKNRLLFLCVTTFVFQIHSGENYNPLRICYCLPSNCLVFVWSLVRLKSLFEPFSAMPHGAFVCDRKWKEKKRGRLSHSTPNHTHTSSYNNINDPLTGAYYSFSHYSNFQIPSG